MKACSVCKSTENGFYRNVNSKDGLASHCKVCQKAKDKLPKNRISRVVSKLKRFGIAWELTVEQFVELTSKPCDYCEGKVSDTGRSLDRIDNNVGYIMGNVVPCCGTCNEIKGQTFTYFEMKMLGRVVKQIREERARHGLPEIESYCHRVGRRDRDNPKGSPWWVDGARAYSSKKGARGLKLS